MILSMHKRTEDYSVSVLPGEFLSNSYIDGEVVFWYTLNKYWVLIQSSVLRGKETGMAENRALLSQDEIDALVSFLTMKESVGNEVLDQQSIDRLVKVLSEQKNETEDAKEKEAGRFLGNAVLSVETDIAVQREQCMLLYEKDAQDMAHILCVNRITGVRYEITPECLQQASLVESSEESWGRAVVPVLFDLAAMQLQVKYTAEVFSKVCGDYARIVFGNETAQLPNIYLPTAARVLENIGTQK